MNIRRFANNSWEILKNAFSGFSNDKVTKLSGSLAYSTVFSMGPLLVVIISLCSLFLGREAVEGRIFYALQDMLGKTAAADMQEIIRKATLSGKSGMAIAIGSVTLLFGATAVFSEIQDSINSIWGLKAKPNKGLASMLRNRFMSFSVLISLGFVLLVSLLVTSVVDGFSQRLQHYFADSAVVAFYIFNQLLTLAIVTLMFAVIFKVLPDALIRWKDVMAGALITAVLFMLGRLGISIYINKSNVGSTFGAAGSIVVVLLWVYYSSLILYFGAEITKAYAVRFGSEIKPNDYAVTTHSVEIETGKASVQDKDKVGERLIEQKKAPVTANNKGGHASANGAARDIITEQSKYTG